MATERLSVSQVETVIRQLRDVIGARVVSDSAGVIQEIHVLSQSERAPKQVVRDVESALQARLGLSLDHKKVSVAQVQNTSPALPARLEFSDVAISLTGAAADAAVRLRHGDNVVEGRASGSASSTGQLRLVAAATIDAVKAASGIRGEVTVEEALLQTISGVQVLTVLVTISGNRSDEVLCGSCVVKQDTLKSAVYASLDAVNRRLFRPN